MARLVIVSNRVALPGERTQRAGGLAVALADALVPGSLWFGWSGQRAEATARTANILSANGITYATIDLGEADYRRYYAGFANGALWPLLHFRLGLMRFRAEEYEGYRSVNRAFAAALAPLLGPDDLIWVHDYQLLSLPAELRAQGVNNRIGFFLHIPFTPPVITEVLPRAAELLAGLAAADVVGFQTVRDRDAFAACAEALLEARRLDTDTLALGEHRLRAVAVPIGIDATGFTQEAARAARRVEARRLTESLQGRALVIGVDRLDDSKGLPQRFAAFARLLERHPVHRRKVSLLQVAARSREDVERYQALRRELDRLAGDTNGQYAEFDWAPLRYITRPLSRRTLAGFFRLARVGLVTPLRDGMNLVAKEYVAAQNPADPGVLVLSRFAGAACELSEALLVNPFDTDEQTEAIHAALEMDIEERRARHHALRERVFTNTAALWCQRFLAALAARPTVRIERCARPV